MNYESIGVMTCNYKVGKRYYSFKYALYRNGVMISEGQFDGSHSRHPSTIRRLLKNGYATELVLEQKF